LRRRADTGQSFKTPRTLHRWGAGYKRPGRLDGGRDSILSFACICPYQDELLEMELKRLERQIDNKLTKSELM
jgi:hypothetical protein